MLAWLLHDVPMARPIVGVSSVEQLEEALAASALDLGPEETTRLNAAR